MNSTSPDPLMTYNVQDYYVVCLLSTTFALVATVICIIILMLISRSKTRLRTVNYLLVCNTCIASIFHCVITINNYIYLIFLQWETSDTSCRWRAYFAYTAIAGVVYSYLIQAVSRYISSVLSTKYPWLMTHKAHYILIAIQWIVVFSITLPSITTKDIFYYPRTLCWVSFRYPVHVVYTFFAYYVIPVLTIVIIYIDIYYRVRQEINSLIITVNRDNCHRHNLKLLRNMLLLLCVYLGGALPSILFFFTSIKLIYLINLVTLSATVTAEKLCTILLDREIRQALKNLRRRTTPILPF